MPVYFIRRTRDNLIKIGFCESDIYGRAMCIRSDVRSNLRILAVMEGGRDHEQALHRRFAEFRVEGEWFEPVESLEGFIRENAMAWDGPATVGHDQSDKYWEKSRSQRNREAERLGQVVSGEVLVSNLVRLGFAMTTVRVSEVADVITRNTGKKVSRQRIANIINSLRVYPKTVEMLAKGLRVDPAEFQKKGKGTK